MPTKEQKRVLITGAAGQIGTELTIALRERMGNENVIGMGHRTKAPVELEEGPFIYGNINDLESYEKIVDEYKIDTVYHLAAILSATGEKNPQLCYDVNLNGLYNILEVARKRNQRLFCPSSIAVFGVEKETREKYGDERLPSQKVVLKPTTMYGVTKVAGELLCDYYYRKYSLDVRGIRYPGLISWKTEPGGGTTDYAVAIYYEAIKNKKYECFVRANTRLPMMYMSDAIKGTLDLMDAPLENLNHHSDYNLTAMSFTAAELAESIASKIDGFECTYAPDERQEIADSWPDSIDDSAARDDWNWEPAYDLERMTEEMLANLEIKLKGA